MKPVGIAGFWPWQDTLAIAARINEAALSWRPLSFQADDGRGSPRCPEKLPQQACRLDFAHRRMNLRRVMAGCLREEPHA